MGVCGPDAIPQAPGRLAAFLDDGMHGQMGWMEDRAAWRGDPRALWPEARSVVMLAESYAPEADPLEATRRRDRAHQGVFDFTYLRGIPNMVVMAPKDENELRSMLAECFHVDGPTAVRYPRGTGVGVDISGPIERIEIGKSEVLLDDENPQVSVLAIGYSVQMALPAVQKLRAEGYRVALLNARFVKPLDAETICDLARRSERLLTIEENAKMGGFGSAVLECLAENEVCKPVELVGIPDHFVHHASPAIQRAELGLDEKGVEATLRKLLEKTAKPKAKVGSNGASGAKKVEVAVS